MSAPEIDMKASTRFPEEEVIDTQFEDAPGDIPIQHVNIELEEVNEDNRENGDRRESLCGDDGSLREAGSVMHGSLREADSGILDTPVHDFCQRMGQKCCMYTMKFINSLTQMQVPTFLKQFISLHL